MKALLLEEVLVSLSFCFMCNALNGCLSFRFFYLEIFGVVSYKTVGCDGRRKIACRTLFVVTNISASFEMLKI